MHIRRLSGTTGIKLSNSRVKERYSKKVVPLIRMPNNCEIEIKVHE